MKSSFWKAGHPPTLFSAFLYFDMSFMVWVILDPLGVQIAADLGLTAAQKGLMVATPVLAGALLRLLMGVLNDHLGPKKTGVAGQAIVIAALATAWFFGIENYRQILILGLFLGLASASFAVALLLASRLVSAEHQGTAIGIAGAGNSGVAIAALVAPGLAAAFGWNNVLGLAAIPLLLTFAVFIIFAEDSPDCPPPKSLSSYLIVLKDRDAWWFMLFYSVEAAARHLSLEKAAEELHVTRSVLTVSVAPAFAVKYWFRACRVCRSPPGY